MERKYFSAHPTGARFLTTAVANLYVTPDEPGEFLVGLTEDNNIYSADGEFDREEVQRYFERFLQGDVSWLESLRWAEIQNGKRTGRIRGSAG